MFASDNIILIGMPASGKSSVGVILAKVLGYDFTDTDILIQNQECARLEEIINDKGIDAFLEIECDICTCIRAEHTVIATGGSVVYKERAMKHLKELGRVVYLKVDIEELEVRLSNMKERGVVLKDGQTLQELYRERVVLYEKYADITVNESSLTLEETVELVKEMAGL